MFLVSRRAIVAALPALMLTGGAAGQACRPDFAAIERRSGGKMGIFAIDTARDATLGWRADERFPFCSSTKAPLAAFVLWKADRGEISLDQPIRYTRADLLPHAPVTGAAVAKGALTVAELCRAAVTVSDNTAANLLWRETGGPGALTQWMRQIGDRDYRLVAVEPALNLSRYGDPENTTTPRAMAGSFRRFVLGDVLQPASRELLTSWLRACQTGGARLRAGLPAEWTVGDKTGTWNEGRYSTIDIAVAWPPGRPPLVISGFVTDTADMRSAEYALAESARAIAAWAR